MLVESPAALVAWAERAREPGRAWDRARAAGSARESAAWGPAIFPSGISFFYSLYPAFAVLSHVQFACRNEHQFAHLGSQAAYHE